MLLEPELDELELDGDGDGDVRCAGWGSGTVLGLAEGDCVRSVGEGHHYGTSGRQELVSVDGTVDS